MTSFRVSPLTQSSVLYLYSTRDEIKIDPEYQRMGEVWTLDKRQLLIDSILNGFDIPKLYMHELSEQPRGRPYKYTIIDGRQRLESIWSFIDGDYPLSDDFQYLNDPKLRATGLTYSELAQKHPRLKARFDATSLAVTVVQTADIDLIEEMFSRLNEAVPLNAAEKRNAYPGPMPKVIREVAAQPFFRTRVRISNRRYQHRDLAAKLLYLVDEVKVVDTKKVYLDKFVRSYKVSRMTTVRPLIAEAKKILSTMDRAFVRRDNLLRSAGMIVLYFILFKDSLANRKVGKIKRSTLERFERVRAANRETAEKDITKAKYNLLEFDRLTQTPNDAYAINSRLGTLRKFIGLKS